MKVFIFTGTVKELRKYLQKWKMTKTRNDDSHFIIQSFPGQS